MNDILPEEGGPSFRRQLEEWSRRPGPCSEASFDLQLIRMRSDPVWLDLTPPLLPAYGASKSTNEIGKPAKLRFEFQRMDSSPVEKSIQVEQP
jgi:hypothetical protein